jgi:hypothetical protein
MADSEALARSTCVDFLTIPQLLQVCRRRGFSPPAKDKPSLAAFVARRFLEPTGAREAMAALGAPWLRVLHAIAMTVPAPDLQDLYKVRQSNRRTWARDARRFFQQLADELLSCGVVLVEDTGGGRSSSRYERLVFRLAPAHLRALPPYPVATAPLAAPIRTGDPTALLRAALTMAVGNSGAAPASADTSLVARLAGDVSLAEGRLRLGRTETPLDLAAAVAWVRTTWMIAPAGGDAAAAAVRSAIAHVLHHLPAGHGATAAALAAALGAAGLDCEPEGAGRVCEEGVLAGLLVGGGRGATVAYAAAPQAADGTDGEPPVFAADGEGVRFDLARTGLGALLALADYCHVAAERGGLRLRPDVVRMGRTPERLAALSALPAVTRASRAFAKAVAFVKQRHGKLRVHEGLLVLRVEDLGLRTLLTHRLAARVRSLGGPYLAVPRAAADDVERIVRGEGFSPRRVS